MIFEKILTLNVRKKLNCQFVLWKEELQNVSMFCESEQITQKFRTSFDETLIYGKYHDWVKRLKKKTGFVQITTTYCLRRAIENAINGKSQNFWFQKSNNDMIIHQTILILTKSSAIWSWTTLIWPFFTAIICLAWFDITLKPLTKTQSLVRSWFKQLIEWID